MRRPLRPAFLIGCAAALIAACQSPPPTPEEIVAAERAFAADGYARGVKLSFLAFSSPDAVVFSPGPVNAHETLRAWPDETLDEPRAHLIWWPLYAGVALSGDLGFTTGPFAVDDARRGHYFTIWRRQPDGAWKWVLDAGIGADAAAEAPQGSPVAYQGGVARRSSSPEAAVAEVAAIEQAMALAAAKSVQSAYEPYLDGDSRLHSDGPPPAKVAADRGAVFDARPPSLNFAPLGGGASNAGDLVWTYGEGRFAQDGVSRTGHYVRIWGKRASGWRLIFDEFIPPPPDAG